MLNALFVFYGRSAAGCAGKRGSLEHGQPPQRAGRVPTTVKENVARAGVPMPGGTALPGPRVPAANAPITDRILEGGGVIMGSTTMPDWGMLSSCVSSLHGVTRSAWNPAWTTGGSSAGAGAAAAAGYSQLHVGTDIGGSIRLPGTWQGLVTIKPSAGLEPLDAPYIGRAAGPMARTAADAALFMSVLAQPDIRDYTARPYPPMNWLDPDGGIGGRLVRGMKAALQTDAGAGSDSDPEVLAAVEAVAGNSSPEPARRLPVWARSSTRTCSTGSTTSGRTRSWADYSALPPDHQR